jgi:hypothetical protein
MNNKSWFEAIKSGFFDTNFILRTHITKKNNGRHKMSTVVFSKVITNTGPLIQQVQTLLTINNVATLSNFIYSAGTLTLNFTNALDSGTLLGMTALVNSYYDNVALSTLDSSTPKYFKGYIANDQNIVGINSVNYVNWRSANIINLMHFQIGKTAKYIYIQKPGTYLLTAKVNAKLQSSAASGTTSVVQWYFAYDDTRSGIAYLTMSNCYVYTCHSAFNNMTDSTILSCVFTDNSITGTNVVLICKQLSGTTPLCVNADVVDFNIVSVPGTPMYEGVSTTTLTLSSSTNVNFGSDRIIQYPFSHTLGQPNVTVNAAGTALVIAKATFNKTSGSDATTGVLSASLNGTSLQFSNSFTNQIITNCKTTINLITLVSVNQGDTVSLQCGLTTGSQTTSTSGETGIILIFLTPQTLKNLQCGNFFINVNQSSVLTSNPINIPFDSTGVIVPPNVITGANSGRLTIGIGGMFWMSGCVTLQNTSGNVREAGIYFLTSVDQGVTYLYDIGSLSVKELNPSGPTTISTVSLMSLPDLSKVQVMVTCNGVASDNIVVASSSNVTAASFSSIYSISPTVNGGHFAFGLCSDSVTVDTVAFVELCRLNTDYLPAGIYRVGTYVTFQVTTQSNYVVQLLDVASTFSTTYTVYSHTVNGVDFAQYFNSVDYLNLVNGHHILLLQVSSPAAIPVNCVKGMIEMWQVM